MEQLKKGYNYLEDSSHFFGEVPDKRAVEIADYKFFWDATPYFPGLAASILPANKLQNKG